MKKMKLKEMILLKEKILLKILRLKWKNKTERKDTTKKYY